MRLVLAFITLLFSHAAFAQRYVEVKCPAVFDSTQKQERGFSTFLPSENGKVIDPASRPVAGAKIEAAEIYVGNPRFSPPLHEERSSEGSANVVWYAPRGINIACRYAGTDVRLYRALAPPANECSAARTPPAEGPLVVRCRTR